MLHSRSFSLIPSEFWLNTHTHRGSATNGERDRDRVEERKIQIYEYRHYCGQIKMVFSLAKHRRQRKSLDRFTTRERCVIKISSSFYFHSKSEVVNGYFVVCMWMSAAFFASLFSFHISLVICETSGQVKRGINYGAFLSQWICL